MPPFFEKKVAGNHDVENRQQREQNDTDHAPFAAADVPEPPYFKGKAADGKWNYHEV